MDPVTRCLHCGKRMVPLPSDSGRTELKCVFCDRLDPMEMVAVMGARYWPDPDIWDCFRGTGNGSWRNQQAG